MGNMPVFSFYFCILCMTTGVDNNRGHAKKAEVGPLLLLPQMDRECDAVLCFLSFSVF